MRFALLTFSLILFSFITRAQEVDSLKQLLIKVEDEERVDVLNKLGWRLRMTNPTESKGLLRESLQLSKQLAYKGGLAQAYNNYGCALSIEGSQPEARIYLDSAITGYKNLRDSLEMAKSMVNYAVSYYYEGRIKEAIGVAEEALPFFENDLARQNKVKSNIAIFYRILGDYESAIAMQLQVLKYSREVKDSLMEAIMLNNIGALYYHYQLYDKSLQYYEEALLITSLSNNLADWANALHGKGIAFGSMDFVDSAILYMNRSSEVFDSLDLKTEYYKVMLDLLPLLDMDSSSTKETYRKHMEVLDYYANRSVSRELVQSEVLMGDLLYQQQNYDSALYYYQQAFSQMQLIEDPLIYSGLLQKLSEVYEKLNYPEKALVIQNQYLSIKDSLYNLELAAKLAGEDARYRYEKLEEEAKRVSDKNSWLSRNNLLLTIGILLLLGLTFVLAYRYYLRHKEITQLQKQRESALEKYESLENAYANVLTQLEAYRTESNPASKPLPQWVGKLSKREMEVLTCISIGMSDKEVGDKLFISLATVRTHCRRIYEKLMVKNRAEAAAFAREYGIL